MGYIKTHLWAQVAILVVIALAALFSWQVVTLRKAHSTFDNYAAFRGCQDITSRTETSGTCTTGSGQTITIVKFENKWFLEGDLPVCLIHLSSYCLIDQP